jgi:hypothetical protein
MVSPCALAAQVGVRKINQSINQSILPTTVKTMCSHRPNRLDLNVNYTVIIMWDVPELSHSDQGSLIA